MRHDAHQYRHVSLHHPLASSSVHQFCTPVCIAVCQFTVGQSGIAAALPRHCFGIFNSAYRFTEQTLHRLADATGRLPLSSSAALFVHHSPIALLPLSSSSSPASFVYPRLLLSFGCSPAALRLLSFISPNCSGQQIIRIIRMFKILFLIFEKTFHDQLQIRILNRRVGFRVTEFQWSLGLELRGLFG